MGERRRAKWLRGGEGGVVESKDGGGEWLRGGEGGVGERRRAKWLRGVSCGSRRGGEVVKTRKC